MLLIPGAIKTKTTGDVTQNVTQATSHNYLTSNNQLLLTFGGGVVNAQTRNDTIVYTCKDKANRQRSNICMHSKVLTYMAGDPNDKCRTDHFPTGMPGNNNYYILNTHHATGRSLHSDAVVTAKTAMGGAFGADYLRLNGQGLINLAVSELRPDLTTMSLPNFFLELDDIPRLFQLWKFKLGKARQLARDAKKLANNAAGANLNWSFGWKPLIGDLQAIVSILLNVTQEIDQFEKAVNELFHRSKSMLSESDSVSGNNQYLAETRTTWEGEVSRNVVAHLVYRAMPPAQLKGLKKTLKVLTAALGFELNPRIIWDALPFTFVLDWFFEVGSFLNMYRIDTYQLPILYVDSYLQYKELVRIESSTEICYGRSDFSSWPRSHGIVTSSVFFHRMPILPDYTTLSGLGWKSPTTKQTVLLVSLATVLTGLPSKKKF
jgi:hypothetical protein